MSRVIVGGGFAGLNAASGLRRAGVECIRVIDSRATLGGSWNSFYDFCRLHGPREAFGVSGHRWSGEGASALASRDEVLRHFASYPVDFVPETTFARTTDDGLVVRGVDGRESTMPAATVIDARGFDFVERPPRPGEVSVNDVRRVVAERRRRRSYVVVGGGKTGMDVVCHLAATKHVEDDVALIQGGSKFFWCRDAVLSPWRKPLSELILDAVVGYDGSNAVDLFLRMERHGATCRVGDATPTGMMFGLVSDAEKSLVERTARWVVGNDYFVRLDRDRVVLRSGDSVALRSGDEVVVIDARGSITGSRNVYSEDLHPLRPDGTRRYGSLLGFTGNTNYLMALLDARRGEEAMRDLPLFGFRDAKYLAAHHDVDTTLEFFCKVYANFASVAASLDRDDLQSYTLDVTRLHPVLRRLYAAARYRISLPRILHQAERFLRPLRAYDEQPLTPPPRPQRQWDVPQSPLADHPAPRRDEPHIAVV